jgi:hypothetical protein
MKVKALQVCTSELAGGESQLFSPQHLTKESAQAELLDVLHRLPALSGCSVTRWRLVDIQSVVSWLSQLTLSGVAQILKRMKIHYKRGRTHLHSPDPAYDEKMNRVALIRRLAQEDPDRFVMLYEDELSYYRHPTVAQGYAQAGSKEPLARRGYHSNTCFRIAGGLNLLTGRFHYWQRSHFDRFTLLAFLRSLATHYPQAEIIFVVMDNWPVHFHPDVLAGLVGTKICLIPLPTYAPWTNPIEKVWRYLYQQVLHLHPWTDDWDYLKVRVASFLDQFQSGSAMLLSYVGLST